MFRGPLAALEITPAARTTEGGRDDGSARFVVGALFLAFLPLFCQATVAGDSLCLAAQSVQCPGGGPAIRRSSSWAGDPRPRPRGHLKTSPATRLPEQDGPAVQRLGAHDDAIGCYKNGRWRSWRLSTDPSTPTWPPGPNNLAYTYNGQGKYAEAEAANKRALAIRENPSAPRTHIASTTRPACTTIRGICQEAEALATTGPWRSAKTLQRFRPRRYGLRPQQPGLHPTATRHATPKRNGSTAGPWRSAKPLELTASTSSLNNLACLYHRRPDTRTRTSAAFQDLEVALWAPSGKLGHRKRHRCAPRLLTTSSLTLVNMRGILQRTYHRIRNTTRLLPFPPIPGLSHVRASAQVRLMPRKAPWQPS